MTTETIQKLQELVNELKQSPQYRQYVIQHKLSLIDSRMATIDALLSKGILKA